MIDPSKVGIGDFVTATDGIHDYGKVGDIYRLIDSRIPDEETSALGWRLNVKTGLLDTNQAYKLPHDKISVVNRKKLSDALKPLLDGVKTKKRAVEREYQVIEDRINGLLKHDSKEEESKALLNRTFYWMDVI